MKPKVYTTTICPYCIMVKNFLKKNSVEFEEINVSKDESAKDHIIKKTGEMSVPVTEFNGNFISGFDTKKLKELLELE